EQRTPGSPRRDVAARILGHRRRGRGRGGCGPVGPARPGRNGRARSGRLLRPRAGARPQRLRARTPPLRRARPRIQERRGRRVAGGRGAPRRPRTAARPTGSDPRVPLPGAATPDRRGEPRCGIPGRPRLLHAARRPQIRSRSHLPGLARPATALRSDAHYLPFQRRTRRRRHGLRLRQPPPRADAAAAGSPRRLRRPALRPRGRHGPGIHAAHQRQLDEELYVAGDRPHARGGAREAAQYRVDGARERPARPLLGYAGVAGGSRGRLGGTAHGPSRLRQHRPPARAGGVPAEKRPPPHRTPRVV
ncbi:MAG: putative secreted protein, partial [uncultured Rubrobacteraceae bacterium]